MSIVWRDASNTDIAALQAFRCTDPPAKLPSKRRSPHPKPHEDSVERWLHTVKPPGGDDDLIRLGLDERDALVAVSVSCRLSEPPHLSYKIRAVAVSRAHRNAGGSIADACIDDAATQMHAEARKNGANELFVFAWVDKLNGPSQRMCQRNGFTHTRDVDDGLGEWVTIIEIGLADDR